MTIAIIGVVAVFFLGMGVYGLAAPAALIRPFGISLDSTSARSEVRAVYGGFGVAVAGVLALAAARPDIRSGILVTVAAALAGMAFGRVVSALVDGRTRFYPNWFYCLVEIGAGRSAGTVGRHLIALALSTCGELCCPAEKTGSVGPAGQRVLDDRSAR